MRRISALAAVLVMSFTSCSDDAADPDDADPNDQSSGGTAGDQVRSVDPPDTPAGEQLGWLLEVTADGGSDLTGEAYEAHFADGFREEVSREEFLDGLDGALSLVAIDPGQTPHHLRGTVTMAGEELGFTLGLDAADPDRPIQSLLLTPTTLPPGSLPAPPESWADLDTRLEALAPEVGLTVAEVDDAGSSCTGVHEVAADTPRPLASTMKLWVLGALAEQVREGSVSWDDELETNADLATLPSGVLQNEPAGTPVTVEDLAQLMISISDNTATDHLIDLVGRDAVEAQLESFDMASPEANRPFLTINEAFVLELVDYPALAEQWRAADENGRRALLDSPEIREVQLSLGDLDLAALEEPRLDTSWQASPTDVCHALAGLQAMADDPALESLDQILGLEDGGLGLDDEWDTTWFKGGSQSGVLTLSYLASHTDGRSFVAALALADPELPLGEQTELEAVSLVQGAFTMAADSE